MLNCRQLRPQIFSSPQNLRSQIFVFPKFQTPNMYMITPIIKVNEFLLGVVRNLTNVRGSHFHLVNIEVKFWRALATSRSNEAPFYGGRRSAWIIHNRRPTFPARRRLLAFTKTDLIICSN